MNISQIRQYRDEIQTYLVQKLLPFWLDRSRDTKHGGFITHFDRHGSDTGQDEKSLIAQARMLFTFSSAFRAGYGDACKEYAEHGLEFLLRRMWDPAHGGFYWMVNRAGDVLQCRLPDDGARQG